MNNNKLFLAVLAIGIVSLLGFYFFSDDDDASNVLPTSTVTMSETKQPLVAFTPPPTSFNTIETDDTTSDEIPTQTPVAFIQHYFRELKNVPYKQTWAMLSPDFQAQHSLTKYIKWWSKQVDQVYLDEVVAVDGQQITVRLQYQMKNGRSVCSQDTFSVIRSGESWLIDKQRYRNCR